MEDFRKQLQSVHVVRCDEASLAHPRPVARRMEFSGVRRSRADRRILARRRRTSAVKSRRSCRRERSLSLACAEPGCERFLLAFMRRPSRRPDDFESRADLAVGIGDSARDRALPRGKARRGAADGGRRRAATLVGAHGAQVAQQARKRSVAHGKAVDIGHRQGEAGALHQGAEIAQIDERRDARAGAAFDFILRPGEAGAQLPKVWPPASAPRKQPVGREDAADLRQHAGQVVDELQVKRADDEIEARGAKGGISSSASRQRAASAQSRGDGAARTKKRPGRIAELRR